jgi:signal recognition particle receptor subunit beta
MVSINTDGDRTLFFDFLPLELGKLKGCDVRVQLYTVPGQVRYESTRKLVLRGADGIVFVADSLEVRREKNMLALKDLHQNLKEYNLSIFKVPLVMQFNKRDLGDANIALMPLEQMQHDLNRQLKVPWFPGSALTGNGVGKTLNACLKLLLKSTSKRTELGRLSIQYGRECSLFRQLKFS